ncbi:Beta-ketoacyl synthase, N-terminal,Thiolase-like,Polyketide synthase, beta-ketoacyl synthase domain [Cinara cedri]|uniref:Beta-ketoacyl synthase, N-terminal,Thiolase-like,Polyketide synthase, beta-ketoacyl synthase domain n=1 Tax=Cinara cedri TaxID=506608 RepID=A0A5E4NGY1_9HEMI|nr:Beta-ketoacyl synthase, N-terminal,Thiolase-like,Polyketide synthase, beta-ketoacyl synthase domain [Cinara cedri]
MFDRKDEIVISGIAGMFPECDNAEELSELLFNKTNGITIDSRRWTPSLMGAICGTGKMKNINAFDATFFGVNNILADVMDPMTRILTERAVEAVVDAGLSLSDVSGTNVGVFMGSAIGETEIYMLNTTSKKSDPYTLLGQSRTMQANRISSMLNLTGTAGNSFFAMDGGWLCGANGLHKAKQMIDDGHISAAIIGTINLVMSPELQFQSQGLNRLNKSNQTKPFSSNDNNNDIMWKSEIADRMLPTGTTDRRDVSCCSSLQRASDAKRSYGTLLNVKSTVFGDRQGPLINRDRRRFQIAAVGRLQRGRRRSGHGRVRRSLRVGH